MEGPGIRRGVVLRHGPGLRTGRSALLGEWDAHRATGAVALIWRLRVGLDPSRPSADAPC
jgi:hypothetical protein